MPGATISEMELTSRKRAILRLVVEEYVASGQPVGSKALAADPELSGQRPMPEALQGRRITGVTADAPRPSTLDASLLSARGVRGMGSLLSYVGERAPLKRNVTAAEVGNTALFLVSDLSSGITGETIYVDCGFHIMGV